MLVEIDSFIPMQPLLQERLHGLLFLSTCNEQGHEYLCSKIQDVRLPHLSWDGSSPELGWELSAISVRGFSRTHRSYSSSEESRTFRPRTVIFGNRTLTPYPHFDPDVHFSFPEVIQAYIDEGPRRLSQPGETKSSQAVVKTTFLPFLTAIVIVNIGPCDSMQNNDRRARRSQ